MAAPTPIGAKQHDDAGELEHRLGQALGEREHRPRFRASGSIASAMPKSTLKTTTCRISPSATDARDVLGKDVEHDLLPACAACAAGKLRRRRRRRQGDAVAGAADGDGRPPDEQRQRRHHLEVDERLHAHPADLLQVGVAGDADDQRGEEQRRDDGADQPQEDLARARADPRPRPGSRGPTAAPTTIATRIQVVSDRGGWRRRAARRWPPNGRWRTGSGSRRPRMREELPAQRAKELDTSEGIL